MLTATFPLFTAEPPGGASTVETPEDVILLLATNTIFPLTEGLLYRGVIGRSTCADAQ
jgi:hypothetical protein